MKNKNIVFNNVLIGKNKIRNIKIRLDSTFRIMPVLKIIIGFDNGDILTQLHNNGVFDKYKKQYLSLIRKTTDEEFEIIQKEHELNKKIKELANEQDEDKKRDIYYNIMLLYTDVHHCQYPSIDNILRSYEETLKYNEMLQRIRDYE